MEESTQKLDGINPSSHVHSGKSRNWRHASHQEYTYCIWSIVIILISNNKEEKLINWWVRALVTLLWLFFCLTNSHPFKFGLNQSRLLAEKTRMRLEYDEAQRKLGELKCRLVNIEDKMLPGQPESDKDRYLLYFWNNTI